VRDEGTTAARRQGRGGMGGRECSEHSNLITKKAGGKM